jgi:hypothetical protein
MIFGSFLLAYVLWRPLLHKLPSLFLSAHDNNYYDLWVAHTYLDHIMTEQDKHSLRENSECCPHLHMKCFLFLIEMENMFFQMDGYIPWIEAY